MFDFNFHLFPYIPILTWNLNRINAVIFNLTIYYLRPKIGKQGKDESTVLRKKWHITFHNWTRKTFHMCLLWVLGKILLWSVCLYKYLKINIFRIVSNEQNISCVDLVHTYSQKTIFGIIGNSLSTYLKYIQRGYWNLKLVRQRKIRLLSKKTSIIFQINQKWNLHVYCSVNVIAHC